jgi:hypothetical protein
MLNMSESEPVLAVQKVREKGRVSLLQPRSSLDTFARKVLPPKREVLGIILLSVVAGYWR